ncbi:hypothetical protein M5D10_12800 [Leptospira santarosai]|uniref:hypothetical protein n=1 Tax=Leptospira santarosai TaxID=28183 RepID=UPI0022A92ED9|nr:hypothetical protein [Leptospira santarosai]UZN06682.1 hypothetical protein M5D10_12800 [Leptospira santarosai]
MKRLLTLLIVICCVTFLEGDSDMFDLNAQKAIDIKSIEYKKITQFAENFLKEYISKQYIFSEASEMKSIESKFFDEKTTLGPPGDQDTGFVINVVENFKINEVLDLESYYEVSIFFDVKKECKLNGKSTISCKSVNIKKNVIFGIRKEGLRHVIDFVYGGAFIKEQLLDSYAKRMKYQVQNPESRKN